MTGVQMVDRAPCGKCGRWTKTVYRKDWSSRQAFHFCWLRIVARIRTAAKRDAWWEGYSFGLQNFNDEAVQADLRNMS